MAEVHFEFKMLQMHHSRSTFGSWDVEKVHGVVAWSNFWSQNAQNTTCSDSDHFWKLWCRKSAHPCGAEHNVKSKRGKHTILGGCEAHFEVKMLKAPQLRSTFGCWDVGKVHAVVARSTFWGKHAKNTIMFGPLLEIAMSKECAPLRRKAQFEVKSVKNFWSRRLCEIWMRFGVLGAMDCASCQKWETCGLCSSCTNDGRRGNLKRICKDAKCCYYSFDDFGMVLASKRQHNRRYRTDL